MGIRRFYININLNQKSGFGSFNLAVYCKRKYPGKQEDEAWYLCGNISCPCSIMPMPVVLIKIPSPLPLLTTLVSLLTICTFAARAAC
jgi:hypothetical protein